MGLAPALIFTGPCITNLDWVYQVQVQVQNFFIVGNIFIKTITLARSYFTDI